MKVPIGDVCPGFSFLWKGSSVQFEEWRRNPDRGEGEVCLKRPQGTTIIIDVRMEEGIVDFGENATPLLV